MCPVTPSSSVRRPCVSLSDCFRSFWARFLMCGLCRQVFMYAQKCTGFRDMLFFNSRSMCMSDCAHSIVSRCVRSLALSLPFPFCFYLLPLPRSETLPNILPPSLILRVTKPHFGHNTPDHMSATFMTRTKIVLFVWISRKTSTLNPKTYRQLWSVVGG